MKNETILYSCDDKDWTYSSESIEDIIDEAKDRMENGSKEVTIYKGIRVKAEFSDFIDVDLMLEKMQENAYSDYGDHAECYLDDVSDEIKKQLELLIVTWADCNDIKPNFFKVKDIEEITIEVSDA